MSHAIALQTCDARHIGFLLLAPNAQDTNTGEEMGDCIFRSLPMQADDFTHDLAERLYDYQQRGEFEFRRASATNSSHIEIAIESGLRIHIDLDGSGHGQLVEIRSGASPVTIGRAVSA